MESELPKTQQELCEFIKDAKTTEDFLVAQTVSSNIFFNKSEESIDEMLKERDDFYITAIENVFNNVNFVEAIGKVLEQYKSFQKNFDHTSGVAFFEAFDEIEIKNKKLIFSGFVTSMILTSNVIDNLNERSVGYTAGILQNCISKLKNQFKYKYSQSEISTVISTVFNKKFYSSPSIKINDPEHLFGRQKVASYLVRLAIRLSFRNSRLNNIFKSIERDKLNGKFSSYSIFRIAEMLKKEKDSEKKSIDEISNMLKEEKKTLSFIGPFKKDKNEENVFNIIDITLREFQYPKNFEENLLKTMNDSHTLSEELKNYSKSRFRAFSGNIEEENYEWSNKIYINCSKLLGALGSLNNALDRAWQVDASVKEFVDWTSSIHKILNKYDIEDDWDKISKYLDQETNKVEWKSSFFTPTQMNISDQDYIGVSKKIFLGIVKTILGMINSDGGVLIIGLIEKPEEIVDMDIKNSLLEKNKKYFFNVSEELLKNKLDLDGIKRKIQDLLKAETLTSVDNFNNLWSIQQINIKSSDGLKEIHVYKIEITKSNKLIYSVKPEKDLAESDKINLNKVENIWVSLLKRADARTIYVDPRKHLPSS